MTRHGLATLCLLIGYGGGLFSGFWWGYFWRWADETDEKLDQ
jgi:hypothetical protein